MAKRNLNPIVINQGFEVNPFLRREVNREFLIKVYEEKGRYWLRGAGTLYKDVGVENSVRLLNAALKSTSEKPIGKIYGRYKVVFLRR